MAHTEAKWSDRFRDWDRVYGRRGVALLRQPAPVPTAPHVRVSPADPSYGVPAGGGGGGAACASSRAARGST